MGPVAEHSDYERRFRRDGLPTFIRGYSAAEDVFNRALPVLGVVFILQIQGAMNLEWSLLANLGLLAAGLVVLLGGVALLNHLQGRPFSAVPRRLGRPELTAFCVLPALLPLLAAQPWEALGTLLSNIAFLGLVYVVVGFGVISIVWWAFRRLLRQLSSAFLTLARAVPLLLVFSLIIFVNTEAWQSFGSIPGDNLAIILIGFLSLGTVFLILRVPRLIDALEADPRSGPALGRRQRANVGVLVFISQSMQIAAVTAAVFAFFGALGMLLIGPEPLNAWLCGAFGPATETCLQPDQVLVGQIVDGELVSDGGLLVTEMHLRLALAIAMINGLYFTIAVLTDSTYREEFQEEILAELRETFAARREYLELTEQAQATGST